VNAWLVILVIWIFLAAFCFVVVQVIDHVASILARI
jgi:hypothetical protein